ncbi:MAG: hypothetical protein Q8930_20700, partial [Bacillota bacterium]|nr:hypothetical protein [Bacillota bacterium]
MSSNFSRNFKTLLDSILEVVKEILSVLPNLIKHIFEAVNKRLRFSITFKTTAIHTFSLTLALLFNTILIAGGIFGLLVYQDYEFMNRSMNTMSGRITDANTIPEEKLLEHSKDDGIDITIFNSNKDVSFTTAGSESSVFFSKNTNGFSLDGRDNNAYVMMDKKLGSGDSIYYIQLRRPITNY